MSTDERLAALARRWGLGERALAQLAAVLASLNDDDAGAPTTVRGAEAVDVHFADSLSALALEAVRSATAIADLGSGAGFPGIVLAIALPSARVALVESVARKCGYLARACADAGVDNAEIVCTRAEEWRAGLGANDLVVARALAPLPVLCEYAAPLLTLGGSLVAWKGAVAGSEAAAGARAAALLGLEAGEAVRSDPYAGSVAHRLFVYRKIADTPPRFPRRSGLARKRPLGMTG